LHPALQSTRARIILRATVSDLGVRHSAWRVVAAATALNLPIGSLYAFSVFLKPLEALLGLSRADLAFVFALAAAGFGIGMNLAPYVYRVAPPPVLVLGCAISSTLGVALAATAGGLTQLAVGYGLLFGAGGGASYILVQQAVNLVVTRRRGLANGYVVSLLPAGAMIAAPLFGWCVGALGVRAALWALAAVLATTGAISAWLIAQSNVTPAPAGAAAAPAAAAGRRAVHRRDESRRAAGGRMDGRLAHDPDGGRRRSRRRAHRQPPADRLARTGHLSSRARPRRDRLRDHLRRHGGRGGGLLEARAV